MMPNIILFSIVHCENRRCYPEKNRFSLYLNLVQSSHLRPGQYIHKIVYSNNVLINVLNNRVSEQLIFSCLPISQWSSETPHFSKTDFAITATNNESLNFDQVLIMAPHKTPYDITSDLNKIIYEGHK